MPHPTGIHRPPTCASAPALWILIPLIVGIAAVQTNLFWIGCAAALPLFGWARKRRPGWQSLIVPSYLAGGLLLIFRQGSPHPDWDRLPQRETTVTIELQELFNARKIGHLAGIGKILHSDIPHDTVSDRQAAFYLESGPVQREPPEKGLVFTCRAVLTYLPMVDDLDGYQSYLLNRDIYLTLNRGEILRKVARGPPVEQVRMRLLRQFQEILTYGPDLPESPGKVLASMLLGSRSLLSDERVELYRRTGSYHLFAVSGLHVGSIALCLHLIFGWIRVPRRAGFIPILIGTWAYVWLTGTSPSAVRAGIMITCISFSRHLLRQPHLFPALVLSAMIVLIHNPGQLSDLGFQLSYGVVASIILVGLPAASAVRNRLHARRADTGPRHPIMYRLVHFKANAIELACISISAGMASMPLIIEHFGLFTPGGVVLGIVLNPLTTAVIATGCAAMLAGAVIPIAGQWAALCSWPLILVIEYLLGLCLRIPGAVSERHWGVPGMGTALLVGMLLSAWFLQRLRQRGNQLPEATLVLPPAIILVGLAMTKLNA